MHDPCEKITILISGLIDEELDDVQDKRVRMHLNECSDCNQKFIAESNIKKLVSERCDIKTAPGYLKTRVRHNLRRQGARPSFWQLAQSMFTYRPLTSSFAVACIVIVVLASSLSTRLINATSGSSTDAGITSAELQGEIICLDCEHMHTGVMPGKEDAMMHRLGIKADNASVWTFLYSGVARELMGNHQLLKKRIAVQGTLFPESHYLQVKEYTLL